MRLHLPFRPPLVVALLLIAGCPREIGSHLLLDHEDASDGAAAWTDAPGAVAWMIGRDPLARTPKVPDEERLVALGPAGEPLLAWARGVRDVERGAGDPAQTLQIVEDRWRGTAAVGLSRGYRLGFVQQQLAATETLDDAAQAGLSSLMTPLRPAQNEAALSGDPLSWLGEGDRRAAILAWNDRHVLAGWLDGPGIPLDAVGRLLQAENYDALRGSALGRLVDARASGAAAPAEEGLADLRRATRLALVQAAADRDQEQAAWSEERKAAIAELGLPANGDPVAALLGRAAERLTPAAADDRAAGGALLAVQASRLSSRCATPPCRGLDRVDGIDAAARWHPEIAALSRVWRVIALKSAIDGMDVGHDTVMYSESLADLVDALLGTGIGPLDASVLRRPRGDQAVWLALGRAAGVDDALDWRSVRAALGKHLARETTKAADAGVEPDVAALLERIGQRATR